MSSPAKARLPTEIILHIVDQLALDGRGTIAYEPSHPITRTLISFTLASRATYPPAVRHLYSRCLHIDSSQRLRRLLNSITAIPQVPTLRPANVLGYVTSLYLAPFDGDSIDDQPTAHWIRELFLRVAPTLKRLVIDMPLRSIYPFSDHLGVRPLLRHGFEALVNLEEFVSVQDDLYLNLYDREENKAEETVWTLWPKLRRLGLYNADCVEEFWETVARMPQLDSLVMTRPDGLEEADIKAELLARTTQPMKILIVNAALHHTELRGSEAWPEIDKAGRVSVSRYHVPIWGPEGDDLNPISVCQDWVRDGAIRGIIWDLEGILLPVI